MTAIGALFVAGLSDARDGEQERTAMRLTVMEQIDVVHIMVKLSLGGFRISSFKGAQPADDQPKCRGIDYG